ncbi:meiosis-specific protein MEI4 isoform X7 [Phyllopteryx taeniolatus]|uniref:meiosis-specific protein MEI4 isoform X7 n=1 Tax=Phyllopteryx taeniolatus TaxID=161469 RepID=UPI002AD22E0D|nr:meiosis-specific protein MEI4 isoform X7 [Phyllopteryx taeniolatus]
MKYLRLRNLLLLLHCSGGEAFGTMCCDGCVCPECFGAKVSVAVAMSVIRRRPAGVGVGRHVHTLAARLTEGEQTWRSKAELLQQEVLGLRQALLVATATATESTGPDVTTESDSDTPELLQLVPAQQQQLPSNRQQAAQRRAELPHEHFLHSCCAFQRADPPWLGPGRDTDTAEVSADAPCRLLDTLAATFRERSLVGGAGRLALKACRASARAMDLFSSRGAPSARLTTRLQASLRELAAILLHASRQPTQTRTPNHLTFQMPMQPAHRQVVRLRSPTQLPRRRSFTHSLLRMTRAAVWTPLISAVRKLRQSTCRRRAWRRWGGVAWRSPSWLVTSCLRSACWRMRCAAPSRRTRAWTRFPWTSTTTRCAC